MLTKVGLKGSMGGKLFQGIPGSEKALELALEDVETSAKYGKGRTSGPSCTIFTACFTQVIDSHSFIIILEHPDENF
jgi:hypothetical protein